MPNNNNQPSPEEDNLTPSEIRLLASELHEFKKTFLYKHFKGSQKLLFDETVLQVIDEPIKGPETLYIREGWIGEARATRELYKWFDNLGDVLEKEIRELEQ
jgi:hypothetical protein